MRSREGTGSTGCESSRHGVWEALGALVMPLMLATLAAAQSQGEPGGGSPGRRQWARTAVTGASGRAGGDQSMAQRGVRRHLRGLLPVQLEPAARPRHPAARLRHAREHLRHPAGRVRRRRARRTSMPAVATASAPTCSSARRPRRCRAVPPTSPGPRSIATSGRPTAPICSRSATTGCRPTSASSPRCSATKPTTPRTTRPSRALTCSISCRSITRGCA